MLLHATDSIRTFVYIIASLNSVHLGNSRNAKGEAMHLIAQYAPTQWAISNRPLVYNYSYCKALYMALVTMQQH